MQNMGLTRKLRNLLPTSALITLYRAFVRPHLHCGDFLNGLFNLKLNCLQYSACLAITGAIRGSSREKLY